MKAFIIGLIAVVIIGGGYLLMHKSSTKTTTPTSNQSQSSTSSSTPSQSAADTITFAGNQFSPATLTVKAGTMVTIKNTSSQDVQMQSNPHPSHTDDSDLNVGLVAAGQSKTFTVTKKGTFGYHNHLDPGTQGKITIE
jgi:plastocyanin